MRHPEPTVSTVKQLYGTASMCAAPDCLEPLYREDPLISEAARNSTVAHICAASPEGPRFDPQMSAEDNRSAENLLLLCTFHSTLIDQRPDRFSVEVLQAWKQEQLRQGQGTPITDAQAEEIQIALSREIVLQAEVINLGGQQGGGGGAIGVGAFGGPGGDSIRINLDGVSPGGGGGALVGAGRTPPDAVRAKEGKGFSSGTDGGDTTVTDGDGNVLLAAKGGSAAGSPYELRTTTDALQLSSLLVCNAVDIRDGLLFVMGGAWQSYSVVNTPAQVGLSVVLVLESGGVVPGHYSVTVSATSPSGKSAGQTGFPVVVEEQGDILRIVRVASLLLAVDEYGLYRITASTEVAELGSIDLAIKRVTDG